MVVSSTESLEQEGLQLRRTLLCLERQMWCRRLPTVTPSLWSHSAGASRQSRRTAPHAAISGVTRPQCCLAPKELLLCAAQPAFARGRDAAPQPWALLSRSGRRSPPRARTACRTAASRGGAGRQCSERARSQGQHPAPCNCGRGPGSGQTSF